MAQQTIEINRGKNDRLPTKDALMNLNNPSTLEDKKREFLDAGQPKLMIRKGLNRSKEVCLSMVIYENLHTSTALKGCIGGWGPPPTSPRPFTIKDIPGKGKGAIATRRIVAGELILKERLAFAMPSTLINLTIETFEELIEGGLEALPQRLRDAFNALQNSQPPEEWGPLSGKALTNLIGITFEQVKHLGSYGAIFLELSRFNHSCCSNASYGRFDSDAVTIELRATHDIAKDAEITIGYLPTLAPRKTRRKELSGAYGFVCKCESCALPLKESRESDKRRVMIAEQSLVLEKDPYAEADLKQWLEDRSMGETVLIDRHVAVLEAIEKEHQVMRRPEHCGVVAACYAALCDEENTRKWCQKADAFCRADMRYGKGGLDNIWAEYSTLPEEHPLWGYRTADGPA